jgi:hypothetical protein
VDNDPFVPRANFEIPFAEFFQARDIANWLARVFVLDRPLGLRQTRKRPDLTWIKVLRWPKITQANSVWVDAVELGESTDEAEPSERNPLSATEAPHLKPRFMSLSTFVVALPCL